MQKINIPKLFNQLGGPRRISERWEAVFGEALSVKTIQKWRERDSIPMTRYLGLMELRRRDDAAKKRRKQQRG